MNEMKPDLSIVIPAYCEERRIGASLDSLASFLKEDRFFKDKNIEILVVAADAPDNTKGIVESKLGLFRNARLLLPGPKVGKGRDVQYGMLRAKGKFVIFMDADLATPLNHVQEFYRTCESGADLVIGTRDLLHYRHNLIRGVFTRFGNFIYRVLTRSKITDTQCGFKMFRQTAARICFPDLKILDWNFDLEILAKARRNNLKITMLPVPEWKDMPHSTYTDDPIRITHRMIRDMIKIYVWPK